VVEQDSLRCREPGWYQVGELLVKLTTQNRQRGHQVRLMRGRTDCPWLPCKKARTGHPPCLANFIVHFGSWPLNVQFTVVIIVSSRARRCLMSHWWCPTRTKSVMYSPGWNIVTTPFATESSI
jgi:hypothetical protein